MSDDLISRSAVMDYLREQQANVIIEKNKNGFVNADVCDGMSSAIGAFMNFIVQMPTAYDVDKVMEQLESILETTNIQLELSKDFQPKESESAKSDIIFFTQRKRLCEELIETVKSGGIERDW